MRRGKDAGRACGGYLARRPPLAFSSSMFFCVLSSGVCAVECKRDNTTGDGTCHLRPFQRARALQPRRREVLHGRARRIKPFAPMRRQPPPVVVQGGADTGVAFTPVNPAHVPRNEPSSAG